MKVSIVIPNYNGRELLERNLPKVIEAFKNNKNSITEIIIVDDGSTDTSLDYIYDNYKNIVKIIKHTKNRGFPVAVNTGVRSTSNELICLLNSDVAPSEDFLEKVVPIFKDEKIFAVSLNEGTYGPARGYFENGYIQIGNKVSKKSLENSFYVSGGSGVFRKNIWQELSGFDEKLLSPFYWEDIDICYRAAKRGYNNYWSSLGKVNHNHESTVSKLSKKYVNRIRERNQLLMLWKNVHSRSLIIKHIKGLFQRIFSAPGYLIVVFMALSKFNLVLRSRKKEIKESVVSDEAVFQKYQ